MDDITEFYCMMERAADAKGMRVGTDLVEAAGALARLERVDGAEADQDARIHQADQERVVVHALADQHAALSTSVEFRSPVSTTNKPKKKCSSRFPVLGISGEQLLGYVIISSHYYASIDIF